MSRTHRRRSLTHTPSMLTLTAMMWPLLTHRLPAQASTRTPPQPAGAAAATQPAPKQAPPKAGTPKDFRMPASRTFTLSNGMAVTLVPYGRVPKTAITLAVRTGKIDEGPQDVSLAGVVADMLLEGTTTRTPQAIAGEAADMGGSIAGGARGEVIRFEGEVLGEFAPKFVALLADVARHPRIDEADFKRVIDRRARDNAISLTVAGTLANETYTQAAYGNHPFARAFPSETMLRAFTTARVKDFHARNFGAKRAHLYVSGVFDAAAVEKAARDAFSDWAPGSAPTDRPPTPVTRRQVVLVDRPGSVQSSIVMGVPASDANASDRIAMEVTDALLGGAFGSRITSNIREDKGYTYSPYSTLRTNKGSSQWVEVADVTTNVTGASITEIIKEMNTLRTTPPPTTELDGIKNYLAGINTLQNSSRQGLNLNLQYADLHGLSPDFFSTYVSKMMAVTPEQVKATAATYLDPDKLTIAIVGDKKQVEKQVGPFKPVVP